MRRPKSSYVIAGTELRESKRAEKRREVAAEARRARRRLDIDESLARRAKMRPVREADR